MSAVVVSDKDVVELDEGNLGFSRRFAIDGTATLVATSGSADVLVDTFEVSRAVDIASTTIVVDDSSVIAAVDVVLTDTSAEVVTMSGTTDVNAAVSEDVAALDKIVLPAGVSVDTNVVAIKLGDATDVTNILDACPVRTTD